MKHYLAMKVIKKNFEVHLRYQRMIPNYLSKTRHVKKGKSSLDPELGIKRVMDIRMKYLNNLSRFDVQIIKQQKSKFDHLLILILLLI